MKKSVDNHVKRGQYGRIFIFLSDKYRKYLKTRKFLSRNYLVEKGIVRYFLV